MADTQDLIVRLTMENGKFNAAIKDTDEKIKKTKKSTDGMVKSMKKIGAAIAGAFIVQKIIQFGKAVVGAAADFQQLNVAMTVMLGSGEKAKKLIKELEDFSIVTPFQINQVNKAGKTLLAFGIAGEDVVDTLKFLGDVASASGKDLSEMARIFGKIQSNGRLMGEELNQLIDAGFSPLQEISERTGRAVVDLRKDMEKGLISFDMVKESFQKATGEGGKFFNLMEKQSKTFSGRLSTLQGNLQLVARSIGERLLPVAGFFLDLTNDLITSQEKESEVLTKTNTTLQAQFEVLKDSNITAETRKILTGKVNKVLKEQGEKQITVKSTLDELNTAQEKSNTLILRKITLAATDELVSEKLAEAGKLTKDNIVEQRILNDKLTESEVKKAAIKKQVGIIEKDNIQLKKQNSVESDKAIEANNNLIVSKKAELAELQNTIITHKESIATRKEEIKTIQSEASEILKVGDTLANVETGKTAAKKKGKDDRKDLGDEEGDDDEEAAEKMKITWDEAFNLIAASALKMANAIGGYFKTLSNNQILRINKAKTAALESNDEEVISLQEKFEKGLISEAEFDKQKEGLDAAREKKEKEFEERVRKEKIRAFKEEKKANIASAIINGAVAITNIWARWATVPAVAIPLTALSVGTTGAQVAAINAQEVPQFEHGGMISGLSGNGPGNEDGIIAAQNGEAVLNKQATAILGTDAINALNEGRGETSQNVTININGGDVNEIESTMNKYFKSFGGGRELGIG